MMKNQTSNRFWVVLVIFFSIATFLILLFEWPLNPEGRFINSHILNDGVAYYEIRDNKVLLLVCTGTKASDGYETNYVGNYANKDGQWACFTPNGKIVLRASVLSITFYGPKFTNTYQRMFSHK